MAVCSNPRCSESIPDGKYRCLKCQALATAVVLRSRYKIRNMVGKGGFGVTYLVDDLDCFSESRILKELCPEPHTNKPESELDNKDEVNQIAERLFQREAKVLLSLKHSGIPKLYAYFMDEGYSYLVQDFIPGKTLSDELIERKYTFSEREVCKLVCELADILDYLHTRTPPIIHRDIKPQNLMRHTNGKLQLIDFGAVYQAVSYRGASETLIGSPGYAPPEQIFGEPVPQSDLYATGATMLRLLTGIHPSKLFNHSTKKMEWESKVKLSSATTGLLRDLLAVNLNKRLATAAELKKRLLDIITQFPPEKPNVVKEELEVTVAETAADGGLAKITDLSQVNDLQKYLLAEKSPEESGRLESLPFPFLLRKIYQERTSGRLTCSDGLATKSIYFEQGAIVYAKSTLREDRLGETLIRVGRITQTDFDRATTVMKQDGIRFGAALIKLGKIDEVELKPLITEQFSSIVYSLFEWSKGAFEFTTGEPRKRSIKISLSTADIIFEGLRRMQNIELIKAWLGDFSWKLSITSDPLLLYQSVNLTPKEGFIVSRIESKMSVDEILSLGGLPEDETLKTICGLLAVGILRWVDRETGGYSVPISTVLADSQQQPAIFDIQTAAAFCYEVENILRSLDKMSHYAVLGIARSATTEQIHEAYALLARKFHPDRHAQLAEYNLSIQSDLENIFERVLEAYHVLSNPITRQVYDQSFKATGAYRVALPKQVAPAANRAEPVVAQTPFSIVKSESIKTEEPKRPSTLEEPVKAASKIEEAQKWFDRGMTYYGSQQFRQACHAFQTSVDLEPNNPEYRIFLARSLAQIKGHHTRAKEHFSKALELEPNNPDYLAEVGLFYQKLGLIKQADIMFEKVLEIVPDHPIARRARSEE